MPGKNDKPIKAKSKSQRRLMGWAYACKKNKSDNCPENIIKLGKAMDIEDLESMAKTKETNKPEKVKNDSYNIVKKYSEFITENVVPPIKIPSKSDVYKEISEERFIEILNTNCKLYKHTEHLLLRASRNQGDYTLFQKPNTTRSPRLSNKTIELINMLPDWKDYPDRKLSLMASTNSYYPDLIYDVISEYNHPTMYIVIPFDNSKLAITPTMDFNKENEVHTNANFEHFNSIINPNRGLSRNFGTNDVMYILDDDDNVNNYTDFKKKFNTVVKDSYDLIDIINSKYTLNRKDRLLIHISEIYKKLEDRYKTPLDMLEDAMNPDKNGFRIVKYNGDNSLFPSNEIWSTDNCLLIKKELYMKLVKDKVI